MVDALHLLSVGNIHLQKSQMFVFLTFTHHTGGIIQRSGNKENVIKSILISTDPGSTSAFSRDCCSEGADGDTVTLMAMQVFLGTVLKEDRDE